MDSVTHYVIGLHDSMPDLMLMQAPASAQISCWVQESMLCYSEAWSVKHTMGSSMSSAYYEIVQQQLPSAVQS